MSSRSSTSDLTDHSLFDSLLPSLSHHCVSTNRLLLIISYHIPALHLHAISLELWMATNHSHLKLSPKMLEGGDLASIPTMPSAANTNFYISVFSIVLYTASYNMGLGIHNIQSLCSSSQDHLNGPQVSSTCNISAVENDAVQMLIISFSPTYCINKVFVSRPITIRSLSEAIVL